MVADAPLADTTLYATRGDTKSWTFAVDWDGVIDSASLTSLEWTVKRSRSATDAEALMSVGLGGGVTVDDATHVSVALAAATWATWPEGLGVAVWDIEARTATQVRTIGSGRLVVLADVRRGS